MSQQINQQILKELLSYDNETGLFTRIKSRQSQTLGITAGCKNNKGYIKIRVFGKTYAAHRLAWLYVYGSWPEKDIDHINGIRDDNRIENLRDVPNVVNSHNRKKVNKNNKFGLPGVTQVSGGFLSYIKVNWKTIYLGKFNSPEAAHLAYVEAKIKFHHQSPDMPS